jgi:hypothetical protein
MLGPGFGGTSKVMFEYANLDYDTSGTANPLVLNVWYEALPVTRNVKAYYLIVEQTNAGATAETIVVELTIDGTVYTWTQVAGSGTPYYLYFNTVGALTDAVSAHQLLSLDADQSEPLETRSLQIRVRQTSVPDVASAVIEVNMVYCTLEDTF